MKFCQEESQDPISLVNPIIDLERLLEKTQEKDEYIAIKCSNTPSDNDSGSYEINLPY